MMMIMLMMMEFPWGQILEYWLGGCDDDDDNDDNDGDNDDDNNDDNNDDDDGIPLGTNTGVLARRLPHRSHFEPQSGASLHIETTNMTCLSFVFVGTSFVFVSTSFVFMLTSFIFVLTSFVFVLK